jgi:hypothetical protein
MSGAHRVGRPTVAAAEAIARVASPERADGRARTRGLHDDPGQPARELHGRLVDLQQSLRARVEQADEPRLKVLLETHAEVPGGLGKSSGEYAARNQAAWRWRRTARGRASNTS